MRPVRGPEVSGVVVGPVIQAGSIGQVIVRSPAPAAMFSMRGDIPDFVGRHDVLWLGRNP
jgi:hypothetical protein